MLGVLILELGQLDDQTLTVPHGGVRDLTDVRCIRNFTERPLCELSVLVWLGLDL